MISKFKQRFATTAIVGAVVVLLLSLAFSVSADETEGDIYHAEEAWGEMFIVEDDHQGYIGDGYIRFDPNVPGGFAEWNVYVDTAGEYTLAIYYAHGGGLDRPGEIKVNGEVVEESLAFLPTGAWNVWEPSSTVAYLEQGLNTVRFTGVGPEGGPNLDHLRITQGQQEDEDDEPTYDITPLSDRMNEALFQQWNEEGLILEELSFNNNEPVKQIEFFSFINSLFGFTNDGELQGVSQKAFNENWELAEDDWYIYAVQAAHEAGYLSVFDSEKIQPDKPITMNEAAQVIQYVLELDSLDEAKEYLEGRFIPNRPFTHGGAESLAEQLTENDLLPANSVQIASVDALNENTIAVTLNGFFEDISPYDIRVSNATGSWSSLNESLSSLTVTEASVGVNRLGYSVIIYDIEEALDENGQYRVEESDEIEFDQSTVDAAENLLTWQLEHGGWTKNFPHIYQRPWDGEEPRSEWKGRNGEPLGTIDNDATVNEIVTMAEAYAMTGDERFKDSVLLGFDFLENLQYPTGGFAQVYPSRGGYSDFVTFNDYAMTNVLEFYDDVAARQGPFANTDLISDELVAEIEDKIALGLDYILNAQIEVDGVLTAWGQQHDPVTYEPRHGRSYEHPSIASDESVPVIAWLMSRPEQTDEIRLAVESAINYLDSVRLDDTRFDNRVEPYFIEHPGATVWYRFYEIGTNNPIFSGRDGVIRYDISEIEEERRTGYSWAGTWPQRIIEVAKSTGYFVDNVYATVVSDNVVDEYERTLDTDAIKKLSSTLMK
ncbi:pectate lyase [Evansella sp. AB-P1]|uniref:pectate lyase n=1 Tax=Evansella sp. AB-P1 TaxID=3037653 RepID=UPI00241D7417|nr:pectate lyase [Evansella sp. AB-P1]MDG5786635.1 pectate lyase [Evansella sp. AB-P1]